MTFLTLYLAFANFLVEPFTALFLVIEGSVIADLILTALSDRLRQPTILVMPTSRMFDVGFYVRVKDKNVQNASVFCDNTRINWKEEDGKEKETKNLRVGEVSYFYPFRIILSDEQLQNNKQIIKVSIVQKMASCMENRIESFERPLYFSYFDVPRGSFPTMKATKASHGFPRFYCNVRLTGEGIEEEINRYLDFSCTFDFGRFAESDRIEDVRVRCDFSDTKTFIF